MILTHVPMVMMRMFQLKAANFHAVKIALNLTLSSLTKKLRS